MREFLKSFFGASGKEISGLALLVAVLLITLLVTKTTDWSGSHDPGYRPEDQRLLDSLMVLLAADSVTGQVAAANKDTVFIFNPNVVSYQDLVRLGFAEKVAGRIINYRKKGGVFTVKADLYKIYAVDSALIKMLYPYIDLPARVAKPASFTRKNKPAGQKGTPDTVRTAKKLPQFDLNQADTAMLQTINGIGSVLSQRIVEFRTKLGGFISKNQLYEVYNLDSLVVARLLDRAYIEPEFKPQLLAINRATIAELAAHPYLSWQQARLIVAYRNQHGSFTAAADLLEVYAVDKEDVKRIAPYIDWSPTN